MFCNQSKAATDTILRHDNLLLVSGLRPRASLKLLTFTLIIIIITILIAFELECSKAMDVAIIVDMSSSVGRENFEKVKAFLNELVAGMPVSPDTAHVSVIRFNHRPYLDWDFGSYKAQNLTALREAISELRYMPGGTRTDKALELAAAKVFEPSGGERSYAQNVLLVITDGKTSRRSKPYPEVLKPLKVISYNLVPRALIPHLGAGKAPKERG